MHSPEKTIAFKPPGDFKDNVCRINRYYKVEKEQTITFGCIKIVEGGEIDSAGGTVIIKGKINGIQANDLIAIDLFKREGADVSIEEESIVLRGYFALNYNVVSDIQKGLEQCRVSF